MASMPTTRSLAMDIQKAIRAEIRKDKSVEAIAKSRAVQKATKAYNDKATKAYGYHVSAAYLKRWIKFEKLPKAEREARLNRHRRSPKRRSASKRRSTKRSAKRSTKRSTKRSAKRSASKRRSTKRSAKR